ncbi:acyl carrier protein [Streptomyces sp. NPDC015220]|uniref:acyl carrier protein n=1 Tax=Streptomyces sp. NPDC015220 TaxID=3364947 RepID=UPI0036FECE74
MDDRLLDRVRDAWALVLGTEDPAAVPLDTNFLEAGGSSLLLIMLWEELSEQTDRDLRVSDLFEHSTVRAQAALLAGETPEPVVAEAGPQGPGRGDLLGLRGAGR